MPRLDEAVYAGEWVVASIEIKWYHSLSFMILIWDLSWDAILFATAHECTDQAYRSKSVRQYDTHVQLPIYGYQSLWDYCVKTPFLCINSHDDPICSAYGIPHEVSHRNPHVIFVESHYGGHLGFRLPSHQRLYHDSVSWADDCALDFLDALLLENAALWAE